MSEIDLDAIEARIWNPYSHIPSRERETMLSLIALIRSERAAREAAERKLDCGGACREPFSACAKCTAYDLMDAQKVAEEYSAENSDLEDERDSWKARALAAEPFMRAFEGIDADTLRIFVAWSGQPVRPSAEHTERCAKVRGAIEAIAAHLRAQDEPKREPSGGES